MLPVRSWGQDALKKALPDAPSPQTVDFIVTGHSEELLRMMVKPLVESFLTERGLVPSPEKTFITLIEDGFDFLGQNVRRYPHGKLFIKPARKSVVSVLAR